MSHTNLTGAMLKAIQHTRMLVRSDWWARAYVLSITDSKLSTDNNKRVLPRKRSSSFECSAPNVLGTLASYSEVNLSGQIINAQPVPRRLQHISRLQVLCIELTRLLPWGRVVSQSACCCISTASSARCTVRPFGSKTEIQSNYYHLLCSRDSSESVYHKTTQ